MAKNNEYRMQISKKFPDGTIVLGRGDSMEELQNSLDDALEVAGVGALDVPQVWEGSQDPNDKVCPFHQVPMTEFANKSGKGTHWRHDTTDPEWTKDSKYDSVYCFGNKK